jgi:hypothetical protein
MEQIKESESEIILKVIKEVILANLEQEPPTRPTRDDCGILANQISEQIKNNLRSMLIKYKYCVFCAVLINSEQIFGLSTNYRAKLKTDGNVNHSWHNDTYLCFVNLFAASLN